DASSSITVLGGMRPPLPTTVGAGNGLPVDSVVTTGDASSVVVRLPVDVPPERNSCTRPLTCTESPMLTTGAAEVNTKMPSAVASLASGRGSCIQNPFVATAVTIPFVDTT